MKEYVCIDVGGTSIKHGVINEAAEIVAWGEQLTQAWQGGPRIVEKVKGIVRQYQKEHEIFGIGISTAGMVDAEKGRVFYSSSLIPDYTGTEWKALMEDAFHIPCEVENDVCCAGLAEATSGAAAGSEIVLCLTVGTGIGASMITRGEVFHGFSGSAFEVGYLKMEGGDFQDLAATSALVKKVAEKKRESEKEWDGKRVFAEARAGDLVCIHAIDEMADVLGKGIANLCYVVNPQTVVLGGGVMAEEAYLKDRIWRAVETYLLESVLQNTTIVFAKYRNEAGIMGAFYHFQACQKRRKKQ